MIEFFKKLFGAKPAEKPAPYKVEAPKLPEAVATAKPAPKAKKSMPNWMSFDSIGIKLKK